MITADLADTTLAILAGGAGSRMGMPKAKLRIGGEPIPSWLLNHLDWPGPTMLVTAPAVGAIPGAEQFDRCVSDPADGQGPLPGILTALEILRTPMVAVMTVDMPCVRRSELFWLISALVQRPSLAGMMCRVRLDGRERIEPFPSVYRAAAVQLIAQRLADGRRSVHDLLNDPQFAAVAPPADWPVETWLNLNTPQEFAAFESAMDRMEKLA